MTLTRLDNLTGQLQNDTQHLLNITTSLSHILSYSAHYSFGYGYYAIITGRNTESCLITKKM